VLHRATLIKKHCQIPFGARAFTLIELLVVIAILAVLAALLLPVLSQAKQRGYRVGDLNNLKQFGVAMNLVASDNNDGLRFANWLSLEQGPNPPQGWLYTFNSAGSGSSQFPVRTGSFWTVLTSAKMYFCPKDNTNSLLFQARPQQSSSYVMNGAVCDFGQVTNTLVKLSRMSSAGVAFWECNNATLDDNQILFNDGASSPDENTIGRHGALSPVADFDGSARFMPLKEWTAQVNAPGPNELWCYPGSPNGQ